MAVKRHLSEMWHHAAQLWSDFFLTIWKDQINIYWDFDDPWAAPAPSKPPPHPNPTPSRTQPTYPTSQGSTEGAWSDINAALSGFSLLLLTCVASISGTLLATPTFGFAPKTLLSPWLLMTGPIVFRFKAIQLGVISPLSDYQWPIDSEEGHAN